MYLPFMKSTLRVFILGFFLSACTEISYKEPQPTGIKVMKEVPAKLQGKYLVSDPEGDDVDTLSIYDNGYQIGNDDKAGLGDSLVLKYYKGHYFVNMREDYAWYLRIVKREKNGNLLYMEMEALPGEDEKKKNFIDRLSKDTPVIESQVEDKTFYIIDPSPQKLMELIDKGYFKKQTFTRIK